MHPTLEKKSASQLKDPWLAVHVQNLPSNFARWSPRDRECLDHSCRIYNFIIYSENSIVRTQRCPRGLSEDTAHASTSDGKLALKLRYSIRQKGNRNITKRGSSLDITDINRYLWRFRLPRDSLPAIPALSWTYTLPRSVMDGILTTLHTRFSCRLDWYQTMCLLSKHFFHHTIQVCRAYP